MPIWDSKIRTRAGALHVSDTGGRRAPIVMLHGSGASHAVFARQFDSPLAELHRLIAIDLPGHGLSENSIDPGLYALPEMGAALNEVMGALELQRPTVLGWSLGGHVAIEMLAQGAPMQGLMLSGTPPLSPGPIGMLRGFQANLDLLLAAKEQFSERDALRFYQMCFHGAGDAGFLEAIRRADGRVRVAISRSLMQGEGADQKKMVERSSIPIAIVNGELETVTRLSYLSHLDYANLWGGTCHVLANAGHAPFWDQPDLFNRLLGQFAADTATVAVSPSVTRQRRA